MRFVSFVGLQGATTAGMVLAGSEHIVDLSHPACKTLMGNTPATVQALLEHGISHWVQRLEAATLECPAIQSGKHAFKGVV